MKHRVDLFFLICRQTKAVDGLPISPPSPTNRYLVNVEEIVKDQSQFFFVDESSTNLVFIIKDFSVAVG